MKTLREVTAFMLGDDLRLSIGALASVGAIFVFRNAAEAWLALPLLISGLLIYCVQTTRSP